MQSHLLTDVFTFLCFLHADDIAPSKLRLLSPTALVQLDRQLLVPDKLNLLPRARRGGKHGPSELETERIRFIHFLCEAAGLVALTGRFLKPTPRATHWLKASPHDRAAQLFEAAFPLQPDRALDQLWRAYRLPGWQHTSLTTTLVPLWDILRQARREDTRREDTRRDEAHQILSAIYGWFTEGFDTPDLQEARALLKELSPDRGEVQVE